MGEPRKLWEGKIPDDLEIYHLAFELHKTPDEIRAMPPDDRKNMQMIMKAKGLASAELAKRV